MQFVEVEIERTFALHAQRATQHFGHHEWIAVAVAADPAPHAEKRRQFGVLESRVVGRELVFDLGIDPRQLAQECVVIIGEIVGDLIAD